MRIGTPYRPPSARTRRDEPHATAPGLPAHVLALQRSAGNQAVARALRHDPDSPGALTYPEGKDAGQAMTADQVLTAVYTAAPALRAQDAQVRAALGEYAGEKPPDLVYNDGAGLVAWLAGEGIAAEEAIEGGDGEAEGNYDARFQAALREFAEATAEMDFGGSGTVPRFDGANWTCAAVVTPKKGVVKRFDDVTPLLGRWKQLVKLAKDIDLEYHLKPGVAPSSAIREIQAHPDRWALDCIDYVVATRLYAECVAGGNVAFDEKYANLVMAQHKTSGLVSEDFWLREAQGEEFTSRTTGEGTEVQPTDAGEEDEFLASVPIGSRVMWTTTHPDAAEDMENENTIKIGDDLYAAHPLGNISGDGVRDELVADDDDALTPDEREQQKTEHIYLAEIEWYGR